MEKKVALITGGSRGIGKAIAEKFAKNGYDLVINYVSDNTDLEAIKEEFKQYGSEVLMEKADVSNYAECEKMVTSAIEKFGRIDVLVNNAGVARIKPFLEMTDEERDFHFDVNINGSWNVTKEILPYMVENEYGKIINLSSVTGISVADPGEVAYATTKAALVGFTKSLAVEFASKHINVNAILPGYIKTPMVQGIAEDSNAEDPQKVIDGIADAIPMGRLGKINELGELAAFLASEESSYITGSTIVIDGGSTLPETISVGR